MNPPINFLPWRQQRRTAFLRFWLLMFVAPLLLAVGITLILRLTGSAEARIDAVLLQGEQQLAHSLQITKPRLLEQQQLREQRLQRQRQRQFTRDWQSALEALAALLPEHAWLTTISWRQGTLEIKGLTTSITALNALETSLRQDASFHLNQRGATQQDAQGRWQFEYQLTRKVSDEHRCNKRRAKEMATGAAKRCAGKRLDNFTADARRTNAGNRDKLRTATMVVATARRYK